MDTPSPCPPHARQCAIYLALAARYHNRAARAAFLDLKDGFTRLAAGYEALAKSFAKLDRSSGGKD
jgi:hypothetical protein